MSNNTENNLKNQVSRLKCCKELVLEMHRTARNAARAARNEVFDRQNEKLEDMINDMLKDHSDE